MWIYPPELLPLKLRSRGNAIAVISQWLWTFLVVEITPPMITNIGYKSYIVFAVFNFVTVPIVWFTYPVSLRKRSGCRRTELCLVARHENGLTDISRKPVACHLKLSICSSPTGKASDRASSVLSRIAGRKNTGPASCVLYKSERWSERRSRRNCMAKRLQHLQWSDVENQALALKITCGSPISQVEKS